MTEGLGAGVSVPGSAPHAFRRWEQEFVKLVRFSPFLLTLNSLQLCETACTGTHQLFRSAPETLSSCSPNPYFTSECGRTDQVEEKVPEIGNGTEFFTCLHSLPCFNSVSWISSSPHPRASQKILLFPVPLCKKRI